MKTILILLAVINLLVAVLTPEIFRAAGVSAQRDVQVAGGRDLENEFTADEVTVIRAFNRKFSGLSRVVMIAAGCQALALFGLAAIAWYNERSRHHGAVEFHPAAP